MTHGREIRVGHSRQQRRDGSGCTEGQQQQKHTRPRLRQHDLDRALHLRLLQITPGGKPIDVVQVLLLDCFVLEAFDGVDEHRQRDARAGAFHEPDGRQPHM